MTFDPKWKKVTDSNSLILLDTIKFSCFEKIQPFPALGLAAKSIFKKLNKEHYLQTMHWLLGEAVT